ncbi:hypothetical protein [Amycolatopsis sp. EV170708-02-1]|uniref:hypothetical protein n=1 Tax=Amycolatopsis sp. EV170708-02-1 TaxID=2919322 RepID=UPI001F0C3E1D|nr:hypothetical protein [Amycolatopsis sp. EV170708-02-1]UMP00726.1 hypothetical protein MJQ72_30175 [Amycolatopsis sp. EV170708-02-1]
MASIEEMYKQLTTEVNTHIPKLAASSWLWREARAWIDEQATLLYQQANQLVTQDRWPDAAGRQFLARVGRDVGVMRTWTDDTGMADSILDNRVPVPQTMSTPNVLQGITDLDAALWTVHREVEKQVIHYNGLSEEDRGKQRQDIEKAIAAEIAKLAQPYEAAARAMWNAVGRDWEGPRAATSGQGNPGPATNGVPVSGAASPSASPSPSSPQPQEPSPTEEEAPEATDPLKDALEAAPGALDALSQVMQSAQQLLGGGTASPSPTPLSPVDPLGTGNSPTPAEVADRLAELGGDGAGLPSLAGGGVSPVGTSGGGAGGVPSPVTPLGQPSPGGLGTTAFPAVASMSASGSGGTGATGAPGAMPPQQQQPQRGGARTGDGIKPGAAEHAATGRSRDRKTGATPGVSLLGRSGRGRPAGRHTEPAPAPRRWDRENDTVQLLDEELWQVEQEDTGPRYRAGQ